MATASLTVRILADLNSFKRGMSDAERELSKTGARLQSLGQSLSLGITLPFLTLGAALAKSAADDEASMKKLERTFGASTANMEGFIENLMKTVPATDDELRGLTVTTDTLLRSIGLSVPKATEMTKAVTTLAGDLAAYSHVELGVAQDALEKALAGKTKGLQQFGIVINEADIKTRAYSLGLAKTGDELTHAQTAQAAWSLILDKSKLQQGEAARTIGDASNAMARLKQSADAAADSFGAVFLPTAARVVDVISKILKGLADLPDGTKGVIVGIGAFAATIGPAIFIVGGLTEKVILLNRALKTLSGTSGLAGLATLLGNLAPIAVILGAPILTAAFAMNKEGEAARNTADALNVYKSALEGLTAAQLKAQAVATGGLLKAIEAQRADIGRQILALPKGGTPDYDVNTTPQLGNALSAKNSALAAQAAVLKTQLDALNARIASLGQSDTTGGGGVETVVNAMKALEERTNTVAEAFKQVGEGWAVPGLTEQWVQLLNTAYDRLSRIKDATSAEAVALRSVVDELNRAVNGTLPDLKALPGVQTTKPAPAPPPIAGPGKVVIGQVELPAPVASSLPKIPEQLSTIRQAMVGGFQQVSVAIGDTLATNLSRMLGGKGIGGQIGGALGGAFGGGVGGVLGKVAADRIGGLLGAGIGSVIPVVGTLIGGALGSGIGGLVGKLFGHHKKPVDDANDALSRLAKTVDRVTASITNVPAFFKVQNYRFEASPVITLPPPVPTPTNPIPPGTTQPGSPIPQTPGGPDPNDPKGGSKGNLIVQGDIHVYGITDVKSFMAELSYQNLKNKGTGNASRLSFANGI